MSGREHPYIVSEYKGQGYGRGRNLVPRPFIKWVGGKQAIQDEVLAALGPFPGRYHEPFLGGGAIFFALTRQRGALGPAARLVDRNERLVRAWRGVRDDLPGVIERLRAHADAHSEEHFYQLREVAIDRAETDAEVAAWLIYLNKTGFNGLYRVNSKGRYNVPFGRYAQPTILDLPNLRGAHEALQGVELECDDFMKALDRVQPGDAVYLDPPYVPLSPSASFTSYTRQGFGPADQERLARRALELKLAGVRVVLSNHDTEDVRARYPAPFEIHTVKVRRFVNSATDKRGHVDEVLIS